MSDPIVAAVEEAIEDAFWEYDAHRKGYTGTKVTSDRDAFKLAVRGMLKGNAEKEIAKFIGLRNAIMEAGNREASE
jgi:hypothetical protein